MLDPRQRGLLLDPTFCDMIFLKSESILAVPPVIARRSAKKAVTAWTALMKCRAGSISLNSIQYRARIGITVLVLVSAINLRHSLRL